MFATHRAPAPALRFLCIISCAFGFAAEAPAQTQAPPPPTAARPATQSIVVVHAGRLLDRPGRAARGPSTLVIRDGRISEVRDGFQDVAGSTRVIDLRTRFVLPGLIDSHVHLVSDTGGVMGQLEEVQLDTPALAYNALANARKTLLAGFTTVRNLGDDDGVTLALRDAIRAGKVIGPTIVDAGRSISTTAGHMDNALGFARNCANRCTRTAISATAPTTAGAPCVPRSGRGAT